MVNGWFPRINAAGDIASGDTEVWISNVRGGARLIGIGGGPKWLTPTTVLYGSGEHTVEWPSGKVLGPRYNATETNGEGRWAGFVAMGDGWVDVYQGAVLERTIPKATKPKWFGDTLAYLTPYQSTARSLIVGEEVVLKDLPIMDFDGPPVVATIATGMYTRVLHGTPTLYPDEGDVLVRSGWVLGWSNTVGGLLLRRVGTTKGFTIIGGTRYYPDFVVTDNLLTLVSSSGAGVLQIDPPIDLTAPMVDLRPAPPPPPLPPVKPMNKPEVTVVAFNFTKDAHMSDGEKLVFHDRENTQGAKVRVWVENGSMRMSIEYPGIGIGETGAWRPVR